MSTIVWKNRSGSVQGMMTPDAEGILVSPDDDFYTGRISREDAIELARSILMETEVAEDLDHAQRNAQNVARKAGELARMARNVMQDVSPDDVEAIFTHIEILARSLDTVIDALLGPAEGSPESEPPERD